MCSYTLRVPAEKFSAGSDETDGARKNVVTTAIGLKAQLDGSPGTGGQIPEETPIRSGRRLSTALKIVSWG